MEEESTKQVKEKEEGKKRREESIREKRQMWKEGCEVNEA